MAEADPDNEMGHFSLGRAYYEAERFAEAAPCFERVLELNATHSKSFQLLGECQLKLDQRDAAIANLKKGYDIAFERGDVMPRDAMAKLLTELGEDVPKATAGAPAASTTAKSADGFQCSRCGRPSGQLERQPFKGDLGKMVHERACSQCWQEWIGMGTKVINEMGLELADPRSQEVYDEHLKEFLQLTD